MAKYRQVHTTFWDDSFVLDLTPEEKYFYLYLMTNDKTTQCGIYELPYRVAEMQTGYNRETVEKLIQRFEEYGKITFHQPTKEIMVNNWVRYNFINSPKVKKCIEKELESVKYKPFVSEYITQLEQLGYRIDTVSKPLKSADKSKELKPSNANSSIPYPYHIDRLSKDYGEEEEKEQEQEEEKEQTTRRSNVGGLVDSKFAEVVNLLSANIGELNEFKKEEISFIYDKHDHELVIEATKEMLRTEKVRQPIRYIEGILSRWKNDGITNITTLEIYRKRGEQNANDRRGTQENGGTSNPYDVARGYCSE